MEELVNFLNGQLLTIDLFTNLVFLTALVGLIVNYTKGIVKRRFPDWAVRIYALLVSFAVLAFAKFVTGDYESLKAFVSDVESVGLVILNSFIVAALAIAGHKVISDPKADKSNKLF